MSSGSACWILWLTPMDWLALSIGRSGSQPLEYSFVTIVMMILMYSISNGIACGFIVYTIAMIWYNGFN